MGLVALLVVLNHFPYDIKLSFMPNVADVKYLVVLEAQAHLYSSISLHDQLFSTYLGLSFFIYCHVNISKCHSLA